MDELTLGGRLRIVRKELGMTQEKFCEGVRGLSRQNLAAAEVGRITPSELVLLAICDRHKVSYNYLVNGTLPKFPARSANDKIIDFANSVIREDADPAMRRLVLALVDLEPAEWQLLGKIARKMAGEEEAK